MFCWPFGVNGGHIVYNSVDFFGWNLKSWPIFFTDDATKKFFPPPKFQHKKFAISFSLFGQT